MHVVSLAVRTNFFRQFCRSWLMTHLRHRQHSCDESVDTLSLRVMEAEIDPFKKAAYMPQVVAFLEQAERLAPRDSAPTLVAPKAATPVPSIGL